MKLDSLKKIRINPKYSADLSRLVEILYLPLLGVSSEIKIKSSTFFNIGLFEALCKDELINQKSINISLLVARDVSNAQFSKLNKTQSESELIDDILESFLTPPVTDYKSNTIEIESIKKVIDQSNFSVNIALKFNENENTLADHTFENIYLINDDFGNTIKICESSEPGKEYNKSIREIDANWSWGDPKHIVKKDLKEFESISNGNLPSYKIIEISKKILLKKIDRTSIETGEDKKFKLFDHQKEGIEKWEANNFHGIFKMCTGAGKTIAALAGVRRLQNFLSEKGIELGVAVVICPKKILVEQWKREIVNFGFNQSPLLAYDSVHNYSNILPIYLNSKRHDGLKIVVTTNDTFSSNYFSHHIQHATQSGTKALLIADEMHNCSSKQQRRVLKEYGDYFEYRLGLSATPEIEGDESATSSLLGYFGSIVAIFELADAIEAGVLCPYKYFPKPTFLDPSTSKRYYTVLKDLSDQTGKVDINLYRERSDILRKSGLSLIALQEILDEIETSGEKLSHTLTFCPPGREDTNQDTRLIEEVASIYQGKNLLCSSITAETSQNERPKRLEAFAEGFFKVLLAIGCLDEGFDLPSTKRAIMLYSIDRERQFIQRRGRVLRKAKGKEFAIIHDIIILPHNAHLNPSDAERLLSKEMRRYKIFSELAMNSEDSNSIINNALSTAIQRGK